MTRGSLDDASECDGPTALSQVGKESRLRRWRGRRAGHVRIAAGPPFRIRHPGPHRGHRRLDDHPPPGQGVRLPPRDLPVQRQANPFHAPSGGSGGGRRPAEHRVHPASASCSERSAAPRPRGDDGGGAVGAPGRGRDAHRGGRPLRSGPARRCPPLLRLPVGLPRGVRAGRDPMAGYAPRPDAARIQQGAA